MSAAFSCYGYERIKDVIAWLLTTRILHRAKLQLITDRVPLNILCSTTLNPLFVHSVLSVVLCCYTIVVYFFLHSCAEFFNGDKPLEMYSSPNISADGEINLCMNSNDFPHHVAVATALIDCESQATLTVDWASLAEIEDSVADELSSSTATGVVVDVIDCSASFRWKGRWMDGRVLNIGILNAQRSR